MKLRWLAIATASVAAPSSSVATSCEAADGASSSFIQHRLSHGSEAERFSRCEVLKDMPSLVLSLDRRSDRLRRISRVLAESLPSIRTCRVRAIDAKDWTNTTLLNSQLVQDRTWQKTLANHEATKGVALTKGAVALTFGHALMWEHLLSQSFPFGLLMEDDVDQIHPELESFLCELATNATAPDWEPEWDLIQLQYENHGVWTPQKPLQLKTGKHKYCMGMYLLTRAGAEILLEKQFPMGEYCDLQLDSKHCPVDSAIRGYYTKPVAATQPGSAVDTDVQQSGASLLATTVLPDCPPLAEELLRRPELLHPTAAPDIAP